MSNNIDFWTMFFSFLFAFVVKDFYDIIISDFVKKYLKKYKIKIIRSK